MSDNIEYKRGDIVMHVASLQYLVVVEKEKDHEEFGAVYHCHGMSPATGKYECYFFFGFEIMFLKKDPTVAKSADKKIN